MLQLSSNIPVVLITDFSAFEMQLSGISNKR